MAREWTAEFAVTDELARALIEDQFPDLAPVDLKLLGSGYDNSAYLVNGAIVFRFPRRTMGVELIKIEMKFLPQLQSGLPLTIPAPIFFGAPSEQFPHPFAGYLQIEGETADHASLSVDNRSAAAAPLGSFLRALHRSAVDPSDNPPGDAIRRADLEYRVPWLRERLVRSAHLHAPLRVRQINDLLDQIGSRSLPAGGPAWVHGDLYARHLIFRDQALCGVIDWGDMHLGDPALDLSIAYSFLPPDSRKEFWEAYGEVDESTCWRAKAKALLYGIILVEYGQDVDDPVIGAVGQLALTGLMTDL